MFLDGGLSLLRIFLRVQCNKIQVLMTQKTYQSQSSKVPQWQSEKMRSLIRDRWQEIQQVVQAREKHRQQVNRDQLRN